MRTRRPSLIRRARRLCGAATALLLWLLATAGPATVSAAAAPPPASPPAPFDHLFLIVMENRSYGQVIGNADMPSINALAKRYGLATDYHGVAHPSLPNYVALVTGDTWGSRSDDPSQRFDHPSLAGQLETKGLSWKGYMQALPSPGFTGDYGGKNAVLYAKKHDPFMLLPAIADHPARARRVVPLQQLGADLQTGHAPSFAFIVPDLCHDMHGAPSCRDAHALDKAGDAFVDTWVHEIMASSAWSGHAAIVITWDESPQGLASVLGLGENHVATVVIARDGPRGARLDTRSDHYALLRTLEEAWGLPLLGKAADAASMAPLFR